MLQYLVSNYLPDYELPSIRTETPTHRVLVIDGLVIVKKLTITNGIQGIYSFRSYLDIVAWQDIENDYGSPYVLLADMTETSLEYCSGSFRPASPRTVQLYLTDYHKDSLPLSSQSLRYSLLRSLQV